MPGAGVGEGTGGGIVDGIERREKVGGFRGVVLVQRGREGAEHFGGRQGTVVLVQVVDHAVGDGHEHGGRGTVAADIGDKDSPASFGQGEEIVIVAARPARGGVVGGKVHTGNVRKGLRE